MAGRSANAAVELELADMVIVISMHEWDGTAFIRRVCDRFAADLALNVVHASPAAKRSLPMNDTTIAIESPDQPDVTALLNASDAYHAALYPAESNHLVDISSLLQDDVRFLVARTSDGAAVGCGAILLSRETSLITAELKRMWVAPGARGTGLGKRLLSELETTAFKEGATIIRLETGINQPEAIQLYNSAGYHACDPFGGYAPDPLSVFMAKQVVP